MKSVIVKSALAAIVSLAVITSAHADGFTCEGQNTGVQIKLYNNTQSDIGTRTPAIMIVSDPMIQYGNKTIAKFTGSNGTLDYQGYGKYVAKVDLRYNDSNLGGRNIGGTKLSQLATIVVKLNFAYNSASTANALDGDVEGKISYNKRNGEILEEKVLCSRYLKN